MHEKMSTQLEQEYILYPKILYYTLGWSDGSYDVEVFQQLHQFHKWNVVS